MVSIGGMIMLHDVVIDEIKTTDGEVIDLFRIAEHTRTHELARRFLMQDIESWLEWQPTWAIDSLRD